MLKEEMDFRSGYSSRGQYPSCSRRGRQCGEWYLCHSGTVGARSCIMTGPAKDCPKRILSYYLIDHTVETWQCKTSEGMLMHARGFIGYCYEW